MNLSKSIFPKILTAFLLCLPILTSGPGLAYSASEPLVQSQPTSLAETPSPKLVWQRLDFPVLPPPRNHFALTLDTTQQKALFFGGSFRGETLYNDLWSMDGQQWTLIPPYLFTPLERTSASLAYDEAREEAILFGGWASGEFFGSTWKYNSLGWRQLFPQSTPSPRDGASMVYDAQRNRIVL